MSTQLVAVDKVPLAIFNPDREKVELIKQTVARGCSDVELELFLYTAKRTGLDPLLKQIYAIKRWDTNLGKEAMTIQTGIDGFRVVASRTGKLAGIDDAAFEESNAQPVKATVTVYKLDELGQPRAYTASARLSEYIQTKKDGTPTSFWKRMPYGQLGKCAEALALRKAFPADLSGVYAFEEMAQSTHAETEETTPDTTPLLEAEKKLLCGDCNKEVDACTIRGNFVTLEKVREASKRDFGGANLCGPCQVLRHSAKRKANTPAEPAKEAPAADSSPDPYFAEIDGKKLVSGTVMVVSSPTVKGKGTTVSIKLKDDSWISCWHVSLHEHLATAKGKRCVFVYSINGAFKNLEEIRKIGDQEFDGKVPVVQLKDHPGNQTKFEATDDDIPF